MVISGKLQVGTRYSKLSYASYYWEAERTGTCFFTIHLHPSKKHTCLHFVQILLAIFIMFWIIFYNNRKKQRLNVKTAEGIRYLKTTHGHRHSLSFYCEVWNSCSPRFFTWHCLYNKVRKRTGVWSWPLKINRNLKLGVNRSELLRNGHQIV